MDFDDSPREAAFRREARLWLEAHAEPLAPGEAPASLAHRPSEILPAARAWQGRKAAAGWACVHWPREYGGRDATPMERVIYSQEERRFRVPPDFFTIGIGLAGPVLMAHGSPAQKRRWLPAIPPGDDVWCQLFSEPAAGSDLASLRTRAERDGNAWVVHGQKIWTSGAHIARWGLLLARTDPQAPKHAGLTCFAIDMHGPGVDVRPIRQINGGTHFNEVFFDGARIPDDDRISEVGAGWTVALTTLSNERANMGGEWAGGGVGVRDLIGLAREARDERGSLLDDAAIRERIADFFVRSEGIRYTSYRALTALSRGQTPGPETSFGKLVTASLQQQQASLALEIQGLPGGLLEPEHSAHGAAWQAEYLYAPGIRIAGGTDEIMRNVIAERVLRLPPEPRVDKGIPFHRIPTGPPAGDRAP